ncbi:hypothetical protein [Roseivivax sp. CAU 1753]
MATHRPLAVWMTRGAIPQVSLYGSVITGATHRRGAARGGPLRTNAPDKPARCRPAPGLADVARPVAARHDTRA